MKEIYCCTCKKEIEARLTTGKEIYPHRKDLYKLHFWICDTCNNYVGTHKTTEHKPLGVIPDEEIRQVRQRIHMTLDPIWKSGKMDRGVLYKKISEKLGKEYHTAEIRSKEDGDIILGILNEVIHGYEKKEK